MLSRKQCRARQLSSNVLVGEKSKSFDTVGIFIFCYLFLKKRGEKTSCLRNNVTLWRQLSPRCCTIQAAGHLGAVPALLHCSLRMEIRKMTSPCSRRACWCEKKILKFFSRKLLPATVFGQCRVPSSRSTGQLERAS